MKFHDLQLVVTLQKSIENLSYNECTPIQSQSIPHILEGKDVAGLAQTGTGKTAAFVIPLIERILRSKLQAAAVTATRLDSPSVTPGSDREAQPSDSVIASAHSTIADKARDPLALRIFKDWRKNNFVLILVPTRELAEQVYENIAKLGAESHIRSFAIYGGTSYDRQKEALTLGLDFVVATPGRLIDLYKEHLVDLKQVRAVVFDEADRMFDMGFKDDMKYILQRIPRDRQFLVFSATLNFDVLNTAYQFGSEPVEINISRDQATAENVQDEIYHVGSDEKPQHLISLLRLLQPRQAIIFSNFKHNVDRIAKFLVNNDLPAIGISSLLSQAQRNKVIEQFKAENEHNILVATDVAARGLDIKGVDLVINYELPSDSESYVHRIGRTGRAGTTGKAVSLVSDKDVESLERIEAYLKKKLTISFLETQQLVAEYSPFPSEFGSSSHGRGFGAGPKDKKDRSSRGGGFGKGGRSESRDRGEGRRGAGTRLGGRPGGGDGPTATRHHRGPVGSDSSDVRAVGRGDRKEGVQNSTYRSGRGEYRKENSQRGTHKKATGFGARDSKASHHESGKHSHHRGFQARHGEHRNVTGKAAPSFTQKITQFFKKLFS